MIRRDYVARGRALVAAGRLRRCRLAALADDGRDLRRRGSRPLARQAAVVSDVGAFRELPDEVAIKVPVGEGEVDALVAAIRRAAGNPEMSAAARRVAATEHGVDRHGRSLRRGARAMVPAVAA